MTQWVIDHRRVDEAARFLRLQHPIDTYTYTKKGWCGEYWPLHVLWVNEDLDEHDVNPSYTIWHELGHALQCERDFDSDGNAFWAQIQTDYAHVMDEDGNLLGDGQELIDAYDSIPWEQEADEIAWKYYRHRPLHRFIKF